MEIVDNAYTLHSLWVTFRQIVPPDPWEVRDQLKQLLRQRVYDLAYTFRLGVHIHIDLSLGLDLDLIVNTPYPHQWPACTPNVLKSILHLFLRIRRGSC